MTKEQEVHAAFYDLYHAGAKVNNAVQLTIRRLSIRLAPQVEEHIEDLLDELHVAEDRLGELLAVPKPPDEVLKAWMVDSLTANHLLEGRSPTEAKTAALDFILQGKAQVLNNWPEAHGPAKGDA